MKNLILLLLFMFSISATAAETTHIEEIAKAKPIHGKALTVDELKDKVILFEYWGFN